MSNSGDSVYVVEIGPNNIWMFSRSDSMQNWKSSSVYDALISSNAEVSSSAKPELLPSLERSLNSDSIGSAIVEKSTIIDANLNGESKSNNPNQFDIKFNFELLRIRSRQFRNSITFNSILYFTLIALFLFIIVLHYRYSSPHYSAFSFCSNFVRSMCGRRRQSQPERVHHSSLSQRMDLGYIFDEFRRPRHHGFDRLPQNETEVVDKSVDDDDDSDVLEDFNPKTRLTKSRKV